MGGVGRGLGTGEGLLTLANSPRLSTLQFSLPSSLRAFAQSVQFTWHAIPDKYIFTCCARIWITSLFPQKVSSGREWTLSYLLLCLEQCLAPRRCSVYTGWVNKWINEWIIKDSISPTPCTPKCRSQQAFSVKGQIINIFVFAGHTGSVATTQLCALCCGGKATMDNIWMNGHGCVPIKFYKNRLWPEGHSLQTPVLKPAFCTSVLTCTSGGVLGLTCSSLQKLIVKFSGVLQAGC